MKATISMGKEIMNFSLSLLVFISSVTTIFAQEYTECTFNSTEMDFIGSYPHISDPNYFNSLDPNIVCCVFYCGINEDDGSSTNRLTENDALHGIAKLNKKYNQFNIYFKYFGYSYINLSQYHNGATQETTIIKENN